jgi:hypothetical protein
METKEKKAATKIPAKVIKRETLKEKVKEAIADVRVKAGTLFIAGVTKAREHNGTHQMMLEVVQKKQLNPTGKTNLLSLANLGDDRFRANTRTVRVWIKITAAGFDHLFENIGITGAEIQEKTAPLKKDETLMTFARVKSIMVEGVEETPTISIKQYSAENGLPNRIQKILDIEESERTEEQDADLAGLAMMLNDEPLVDEFGNQVYELNELTYGEEDNILIKKMPLSEYKKAHGIAKKATKAITSNKEEEVEDAIGSLID